ncbi:MAG: CocE/NonD family hydrolase, partial [Byssovorax sp.]
MRRNIAWVSAALLFAFGCGADPATTTGASTSTSGAGGGTGGNGGGGGESGPFQVRGSVEQIDVWKAPIGAKLEVRDAADKLIDSGTADEQGSLVFRHVPAGEGYSVKTPATSPPGVVTPIRVTTIPGSLPKPEFYSGQKLVAGYQYLTTRDGTKLAAFITLPGPASKGPYPTVVNYSGYSPGKPGEPIGDYKFLCGDFPVLCDAPSDESSLIAAMMGYATVSVNMRGTGCSGGAYDFFE